MTSTDDGTSSLKAAVDQEDGLNLDNINININSTNKSAQTTDHETLEPKHPSPTTNDDYDAARKKKKKSTKYLTILAEQWFLLALGLLIAFASQIQVPPRHQQVKRTVTSYLCIIIIFFVTGATLDTKILLQNYARWKIHLYVQLLCFIMTSAIVFGLVTAAATNETFLDPGLLVGLIFFSCVATTISSNVVMTRQAHGNTALTVVQTTLGNLIGVFVTPALVVMYLSTKAWYTSILPPVTGEWGITYRRVLKQLGLSLYLPLFLGQLTRYYFPAACKKVFVDWKMNKLGSLCLLVLLWATYDQAFATHAFTLVPGGNMVFIVFMSLALWVLFFAVTFASGICWLPREDVVALCMCVPAKGIVMGVPLSATVFGGIEVGLQSRILIPIVVYQGLQLAAASALVPVLRRWVDRKKEERDEG